MIQKNKLKIIIFSLLPALLFFGSAEISLRLARLPQEKYLAEEKAFPPKDQLSKSFLLDDTLFWRLNPGYDGLWTLLKLAYSNESITDDEFARRQADYPNKSYHDAVTWQINDRGFRGVPPVEDKKTILFLGTSITFGWGVQHRDSFAGKVVAQLKAAGQGEWQCINASVPGYSTYQIRKRAEQLIAELQPDVVIVEAGLNDGTWAASGVADSIHAVKRQDSLAATLLNRSNLALWCFYLFHAEQRAAQGRQRDVNAFYRSSLYLPGHARVAPEEFIDNIEGIKKMCDAQGAIFYTIYPALFNEWNRNEVVCAVIDKRADNIDVTSALEMLSAATAAEFFLPYDEGHLSLRGHEHVAERICERLREDGILIATER